MQVINETTPHGQVSLSPHWAMQAVLALMRPSAVLGRLLKHFRRRYSHRVWRCGGKVAKTTKKNFGKDYDKIFQLFALNNSWGSINVH